MSTSHSAQSSPTDHTSLLRRFHHPPIHHALTSSLFHPPSSPGHQLQPSSPPLIHPHPLHLHYPPSPTTALEQLFLSTNSKVVRLYDLKRSPVHFVPALLAERGITKPISVWTLASPPLLDVRGVSQPINDAQVTQLWLVFATHEAVRILFFHPFIFLSLMNAPCPLPPLTWCCVRPDTL